MEQTKIRFIGNYYGGLNVMTLDGKFYWCIENYDTDFEDLDTWEEIPKTLYNELVKYNESEY